MGTIGRYGICEDVVDKLTRFECSYKYEYLVDNLTNEVLIHRDVLWHHLLPFYETIFLRRVVANTLPLKSSSVIGTLLVILL